MILKPNHQICPDCKPLYRKYQDWVVRTLPTCIKCNGTRQIPIELKPGIYGQIGIPPIVMVWDNGDKENPDGPYYLLNLSKNGQCLIWHDAASNIGYDCDSIAMFYFCRLATPEECTLIEPWKKE